MEVTFYHDDNLGSYDQQSSPSSVGSACSTDIGAVSAICRPYTTDGLNKSTVLRGLDLNINQHGQVKLPALPSEGQRNIINHQSSQRQQGVITAALPGHTLASPDVNMLKLGSPDLERLISNNQHNGQQYMQHKMHLASGVTEEQEMYAQGFERELERIKSKSASDPDVQGTVIQSENGINETSHCPVITSGSGHPLARQRQYVNNDQYYGHGNIVPGMALNRSAEVTIHHMSNPMVTQLKEEPPQTVPVMSNTPPPMSPIDLISQEMLKSERKRQRNRVAASKCRKRKLERISRLEDKVKGLKTQNMELSTNANILRQQVAELKSKVMAHVNSGCQLMMNQQQVNF